MPIFFLIFNMGVETTSGNDLSTKNKKKDQSRTNPTYKVKNRRILIDPYTLTKKNM